MPLTGTNETTMNRTCLLVVALLAITSPAAAQFSSVRVQVLDVGQADGILIRTPNNRWILIDAGQDGRLGPALPTFGVDTLELAIATHRHRDHIGGMDEVLYSVPVTRYFADTTWRGTGTEAEVLRAIDSLLTPIPVSGQK